MIDLDRARQRAKDLLAEARRGSAPALARLPRTRPGGNMRLADAQYAVARELRYSSWASLVRATERFDPVQPADVPWERIKRVSVVCFRDDGPLVLFRRDTRWVLPSGRRLTGEDVWDDSVLRIPLECMGFRRQGTHVLALDPGRRHCVFWLHGSRYSGARSHRADVEWWTGSVDEAVALLDDQGDQALSRLVRMAGMARDDLTYAQHVGDLRRTLVGTYLRSPTLPGGSGFGGSDEDWSAARGVLADALDVRRRRITFLDLCCANGYLAACMAGWGSERGLLVEPYGVDIAPELVDRAADIYPAWAGRFFAGDVLTWRHPDGQRFDLVHSLLDVTPDDRHAELIDHLLARVIAPGGRLLLSRYGNVQPAQSAEAIVTGLGYRVAGRTRPPRRPNRPAEHPSVWLER